ncbi:glycogen-binding subunit 76A [Phlebotomus papatasi]|uniref:glycogen-binding subunit 76A n=1 Tax=Phlebotomus papatasi TaxID=29031 RepID=UPI0024846CBD|nr:glycogen-binding subunit 76A [Phlebotomus papatasi]XP_055707619.1 glycogen-binding subunit 76A [Phlebotomus papatasi]
MSAPEERRENINKPCGLLSLIPLGMSCRGRAEAFARRLQSRLRTLGTNGLDDTTNHTDSPWLSGQSSDEVITSLPAHLGDSIESPTELPMEPESPGSPAEECEYTRLIETTSTTPQDPAGESGFVCASPMSPGGSVSSFSSSEGTFFDPDSDYYDCSDSQKEPSPTIFNGHETTESLSESLPPSQTDSNSTLTECHTSTSNSTLQEVMEIPSLVPNEEPPDEEAEPVALEELIEEPATNGHEMPKENFVQEESPDERPQRVQRSSSLKSGKTPPGTPGRKKFVRFADVLGLDLADVRTFLDDVPRIPTSAFDDLDVTTCAENIHLALEPRVDKVLVPLFQQPSSLPKFLDLVRENGVFLENAAVTDAVTLTITGCVRVRNLDFHKSVHIRYSTDAWRSYADLQANYVENSCDGFSDKFSFILFGNALQVGQRLELAIRFQCHGQQFWDNNYGSNYCFQCLPATTLPTKPPKREPENEDSWDISFY